MAESAKTCFCSTSFKQFKLWLNQYWKIPASPCLNWEDTGKTISEKWAKSDTCGRVGQSHVELYLQAPRVVTDHPTPQSRCLAPTETAAHMPRPSASYHWNVYISQFLHLENIINQNAIKKLKQTTSTESHEKPKWYLKEQKVHQWWTAGQVVTYFELFTSNMLELHLYQDYFCPQGTIRPRRKQFICIMWDKLLCAPQHPRNHSVSANDNHVRLDCNLRTWSSWAHKQLSLVRAASAHRHRTCTRNLS